MKRICVFVTLAVAMVFAAASCASAPAAPQQHIQPAADPVTEFINNTRMAAPEDALMGIGTARLANRNMSRTLAETRARAEISRQLDNVVSNMVDDFTAANEFDHQAVLSWQMSVTRSLSESQLRGASIFREFTAPDGEHVTVVLLSGSNTATEILSAVESAARLTPGADAAMWATDRMDRALDQNRQAPLEIRDFN